MSRNIRGLNADRRVFLLAKTARKGQTAARSLNFAQKSERISVPHLQNGQNGSDGSTRTIFSVV
jgi:hypothetical protein